MMRVSNHWPMKLLLHKLTLPDKADIAQEAFKSVKKHFEQSNSLSTDEKALLGKKSSLQDVEKAVSDAFAKYEAKSEASKTRKWLLKASESICHYGQVLDVFVQHHPEYVSLAWGLMKVMFIVSWLDLLAEP